MTAWMVTLYALCTVAIVGPWLHFSLRKCPPVLWQPRDRRRLVVRTLVLTLFWPVLLLFGIVIEAAEALAGACARRQWLRR